VRSKRAIITALVGVGLFFGLTAESCGSSNTDQNNYANDQGNAALAKWGNPKIKNFAEFKMANEVAELRDQTNLVMYAYLQAMDGTLVCYGQVLGYGIPYSTQITPPYGTSSGGQFPVREPNALFMPDSADATWIRVIDPATGKTTVDYVEPHLIVSMIKRPCKSTDAG
jgi:hypothetical protein